MDVDLMDRTLPIFQWNPLMDNDLVKWNQYELSLM